MLYLIMTAVSSTIDTVEIGKLGGKNVPSDIILKIGYTDDNNIRIRLRQYNSPGINLIHTIKGGTEIHEKSLHKYFEKYKYPKLNEWFYYNDEIVNLFRGFTLQDLDNISNNLSGSLFRRGSLGYFNSLKDKFIPEITYILRSLYPLEFIESERIEYFIGDRSTATYESVTDKLNNEFGKETVDYLMAEMKSDEALLSNELFKLRDMSTTYEPTLRYICNEIDSYKIEKILRFTSLDISNYYIKLGPAMCSAVSYHRSLLEKEYNRLKNNIVIDIDSVIYSNFNEGDVLLGSDLKVKLQSCYDSCGYKSKAKANDIENWFISKTYLKNNKSTNKRSAYFELIKKKKGN